MANSSSLRLQQERAYTGDCLNAGLRQGSYSPFLSGTWCQMEVAGRSWRGRGDAVFHSWWI